MKAADNERGRIAAACALVFALNTALEAAQGKPKKISPAFPVIVHTLIDTPTAEVLDYGSFVFASRFFSDGGLTPSITFGIFQRFMFGASMELDNYVGTGELDVQRPELQLKFRFFDGRGGLPAAAIGYDSQGHRYNKDIKKYMIEERGLYLAFTREFLARGMELTAGGNVSDFERDSLRAFAALSVSIENAVGFFAEYDNIRSKNSNRANAGANLFLSPFVQMGFSVRDLFGDKTFAGTSIRRKPERVIDIRYIASF